MRTALRGRNRVEVGTAVTTFPGYVNVDEIATGTFATVYRATELATGRPVALKVLRMADAFPQLADIFDKELGALALLSNHPNVTTLYRTFFTPQGRPVLVLELCRGSLAQQARQTGPLSPAEVVQTGVKIAGALETAHRSGLLHRDVKPQNILVSQFGEPVLGDFGVAALQAAAQSTEGIFGFTTLHAPPEALEGHPLSPAADIYGLASSMYQLALGRGPFAAYEGEAPASVILRILRDPPPRPPAAALPIDLADLIDRALAKDPRQRPQSAQAFAEALRDIEGRAGWAQTPYVAWGTSSGGYAAGGSHVPSSPRAPSSPLAPASPLTAAIPAVPDLSGPLPLPPAPAAGPWRPNTAVRPPVPAGPLPAPPGPPGSRRVVTPPGAERAVLAPLATASASPAGLASSWSDRSRSIFDEPRAYLEPAPLAPSAEAAGGAHWAATLASRVGPVFWAPEVHPSPGGDDAREFRRTSYGQRPASEGQTLAASLARPLMERQPTTVEVPKRRRRFFSFLFGRAALLIALALAAAVRS